MSNSGGVAVRPVDRHPDGHEQVAGLPAALVGQGAEACLELVRLEGDREQRDDRVAGRDQPRAGRPRRVPTLRDEEGRLDREAVDEEEADEVADRTEDGQPLLDERDEGPDLVDGRRPVDPAGDGVGLEERQEPLGQLVRGEPADPLPVEPLEPLAIEDRSALVDGVELEPGAQLVEPEDLLLGPGRPAEEREVVVEGLRG